MEYYPYLCNVQIREHKGKCNNLEYSLRQTPIIIVNIY